MLDKNMSLREMALELLSLYRGAEESLIWEYSCNSSRDMAELAEECDEMRSLIESAE